MSRIDFDRGNELEDFINMLGLSKIEFAKNLGMTYRDLYNLITGKSKTIKDKVLNKLENMGFRYYPSEEYTLKKRTEYLLVKYNIDIKSFASFSGIFIYNIENSVNPAKKPFDKEFYLNMKEQIKEYINNEIEIQFNVEENQKEN